MWTYETNFFSGHSYCVTFIDDYSRKTWIYLLKAKSEVFERLWEFKTLVLRTDNGGEYTSNEFMEYCSAEGIKKEHTVPHTPHQNGVAEQKNKTMVGVAKAMIFD